MIHLRTIKLFLKKIKPIDDQYRDLESSPGLYARRQLITTTNSNEIIGTDYHEQRDRNNGLGNRKPQETRATNASTSAQIMRPFDSIDDPMIYKPTEEENNFFFWNTIQQYFCIYIVVIFRSLFRIFVKVNFFVCFSIPVFQFNFFLIVMFKKIWNNNEKYKIRMNVSLSLKSFNN